LPIYLFKIYLPQTTDIDHYTRCFCQQTVSRLRLRPMSMMMTPNVVKQTSETEKDEINKTS